MVHLNDISKVYMEKVAKPDFLDLDKDGNKKESMKKAASEAPKERLKTDRDGYRIPQKDADAAKERLLAKARAKRAKMSEALEEGAIADRLKAMAKEKKKDWDKKGEKAVDDANKAMDKVKKTQKDMESSSFIQKEGLDPVGQEDADVDNDGKKNTKSDKYLMNRRKAIGKAIANEETTKRRTLGSRFKNDEERREYIKQLDKKSKEKRYNRLKATVEEVEEVELDEKVDVRKQSSKRKSLGRGSSIKDGSKKRGYESPKEFRDAQKKLAPYMKEAKNVHGEIEVPSGKVEKLAKKASKRIDTDVDGDVEHNDKHKGEYGEFVPTPDGKKKVFTGPNRVRKESFSNWRQDLIEVISDDENDKPVKEKGVKNKIVINPEMKEAVEEIGGTVIEMVELDEMSPLAAGALRLGAGALGAYMGKRAADKIKTSRENRNKKTMDTLKQNESAELDEMNFEINPAAHRQQMKQKKIYNKGQSTTNPNEKDAFMKRTGPQLPLANKSSSMQVAHYDPSEDKIAELLERKKEIDSLKDIAAKMKADNKFLVGKAEVKKRRENVKKNPVQGPRKKIGGQEKYDSPRD